MTPCSATILIPTTGNRGELLRLSVASVLRQTLKDFEILIVGDGVTDETRDVIAGLRNEDPRIAFHDFPKHERRGEPNRHQVIKGSRGKNIFYLCDRDLMLPDHLQTLTGLLAEYDFVSSTFIRVNRDKSLNIDQYVGYFGPGSQVEVERRRVGSLSCIGHTRAMYDRLPFGWRTTPVGYATDGYMWRQFITHPDCQPFSTARPTILYFKRGHFPGEPVAERAKELAYWSNIVSEPEGLENVKSKALAGLLLERRFYKQSRVKKAIFAFKRLFFLRR